MCDSCTRVHTCHALMYVGLYVIRLRGHLALIDSCGATLVSMFDIVLTSCLHFNQKLSLPSVIVILLRNELRYRHQEIEEEEDSGCESEGQILTPPSSPGSGQGHSNSSHSSSGSSMLDVQNLNLHGTGGRSAIVRVTTSNAQGVAR